MEYVTTDQKAGSGLGKNGLFDPIQLYTWFWCFRASLIKSLLSAKNTEDSALQVWYTTKLNFTIDKCRQIDNSSNSLRHK